MKKLVMMTAFFCALATPAFALDLETARNEGDIGERTDGYIGAIKNTPEVQALVAEVNAKRRQKYVQISKVNNQPVTVVGKLAAPAIIDRLDSGDFYQGADGTWQKK